MFSVSVPTPFWSSTVRDAARCHPSRSTVPFCSLKRQPFIAYLRHQPPSVAPSARSSEPSRVLPTIYTRRPSVHRRRLWGQPGSMPPIIEKRPCFHQLLPRFPQYFGLPLEYL